jgi:hypothetical protein
MKMKIKVKMKVKMLSFSLAHQIPFEWRTYFPFGTSVLRSQS